MTSKEKEKNENYKEKYYLIEYYSGELEARTLPEAILKVLFYRKNPSWAFGNGEAKIYVMEKETIIKKGRCVRHIKPRVKKK